MKTTLYALASVAVLAAAATPAAAEGFRAEIHGGWDHASADNQGESGIVYGIGAGDDVAIAPKLERGLVLGADLGSLGGCESGVSLPNDTACIDAKRALAAAIRLGYKVSDRGTLSALAGDTNARFRFVYTTPAGVTTRDSRNLDG